MNDGIYFLAYLFLAEKYSANLEKMWQSWCLLLSAWRQEITIRGHRDDTTSTSINKGNSKALLDMRIDAGDEVLKQHQKDPKMHRFSFKVHIRML